MSSSISAGRYRRHDPLQTRQPLNGAAAVRRGGTHDHPGCLGASEDPYMDDPQLFCEPYVPSERPDHPADRARRVLQI